MNLQDDSSCAGQDARMARSPGTGESADSHIHSAVAHGVRTPRNPRIGESGVSSNFALARAHVRRIQRTAVHRSMRVLGLVTLLFCGPLNAQDDLVERGQYLTYAGGCITCHTEDVEDATPLAGGRAMESPFGTFYSPNITPDDDTGIGSWSDDDFVKAFWEGESPAGDHYFPAFPYTSYTGATREDLLAIKAYLFSLPPVNNPNREHDLAWYMSSRAAAGAWKGLNFEPARFMPDPVQSETWNRGAYLVRHLGHCGECHTPRSTTGVLQIDKEMSGSQLGEEFVPNISTHRIDGIGRWSVSDIEYFLDIGMLPDGDFTGSSMVAVIDDNTSKLTRDDRRAIAEYLKSLPPYETSN